MVMNGLAEETECTKKEHCQQGLACRKLNTVPEDDSAPEAKTVCVKEEVCEKV
jgi:TPP-dependent indolepyruvate ferredoxin oxidoreductase alpha subunit